MKAKLIISIILIIVPCLPSLAQSDMVTIEEFQKVTGKWTGKLIYLDYQSNKPYEMPTDLEVTQINNSGKFKFFNSYPDESSANSVDTVVLSDDGKLLDNETIKSKEILQNGDLQIVTEIAGKDGNDNKEAFIKHTYIIAQNNFEVKKEVLFSGSQSWLLRHTYMYIRR